MNRNSQYYAAVQMEFLPQATESSAEPAGQPDQPNIGGKHSDDHPNQSHQGNRIPSGRSTGKALPESKNLPIALSLARILVAADHAVVRLGITQLVSRDPAFTVCGETDMPRTTLDAITELNPTAAIIDITMPGKIDLIREIRRDHASLPILAFSLRHNPTCAERVIRAGTLGYILEHEFKEKLVDALRLVVAGKAYYSHEVATHLWNRMHRNEPETPVDSLSDREFEVMRQIGTGSSTQQIAKDMGRSVKTIETHRAHIKEKLNLKSAPELARFAAQWNLESGEGGPSL